MSIFNTLCNTYVYPTKDNTQRHCVRQVIFMEILFLILKTRFLCKYYRDWSSFLKAVNRNKWTIQTTDDGAYLKTRYTSWLWKLNNQYHNKYTVLYHFFLNSIGLVNTFSGKFILNNYFRLL